MCNIYFCVYYMICCSFDLAFHFLYDSEGWGFIELADLLYLINDAFIYTVKFEMSLVKIRKPVAGCIG
jgi:hypothetical protein